MVGILIGYGRMRRPARVMPDRFLLPERTEPEPFPLWRVRPIPRPSPPELRLS